MDRTRSGASRRPITFRLRADLIQLVEAVAAKSDTDRSRVIEDWVEEKLEGEYPGCTKEAA